MTAMPQMVALFNGVGGGAVALIAWVGVPQHRRLRRRADLRRDLQRCSRRSSARSRSGARTSPSPSCRRSSPAGRSRSAARSSSSTSLLLVGRRRRCAVAIVAGADDELLMHRAARRRGAARQLRRAADRRRRHAGRHLAAQRVHRPAARPPPASRSNNTALIVAGMIVGASRHDPHQPDGRGHEPLDPVDRRRRLRRRDHRPAARPRTASSATVRSTSAADAAIQLAYASQVVIVPGYGMAVAQAQHAVREMTKLLGGQGRRGQVRDPPGRRAHARAT